MIGRICVRQVHQVARWFGLCLRHHLRGVIATNYHVIEDKDGATLEAMDLSGKTYPVTEVLAASKADSVAILRLKGRG